MWAMRVGGVLEGNGLLTAVTLCALWKSRKNLLLLMLSKDGKVAYFVCARLLFEKRLKLSSWLLKNNQNKKESTNRSTISKSYRNTQTKSTIESIDKRQFD